MFIKFCSRQSAQVQSLSKTYYIVSHDAVLRPTRARGPLAGFFVVIMLAVNVARAEEPTPPATAPTAAAASAHVHATPISAQVESTPASGSKSTSHLAPHAHAHAHVRRPRLFGVLDESGTSGGNSACSPNPCGSGGTCTTTVTAGPNSVRAV